MADKKNLLLLFERPGEPVFTPKGEENAVFEVPNNFLEERFQEIGTEIQTRFGEESDKRIPVQNAGIPNLGEISKLEKQENFSLFIPRHRKLASALQDIFLKAKDINQLQSYAVYARDRVNAQLFNYALSVAILHRPDTKDLNLPLFVESFPGKFLDSRAFVQARQEASVVPMGSRKPIIIPRDYTASNLEPEHVLWYFREDLGINLHHWHWHLVYPTEASDISIVAKDRRGELFYYMHQQIMARYNLERYCNNLPKVVSLNNLRAPIPEGYFSKLDNLVASRSWPARASNITLRDVNRQLDQVNIDVATMERWRSRFLEAVNNGFAVRPNGQRLPLDETTGIDILGNMMEAAPQLSANSELYGDLHNMGHTIISYQHDPDHRHLESFGVIGDNTTAMRDPAFYRWHSEVDDMFEAHKRKLTPYTVQQLTFPGIRVQGVQVQPVNGRTNVFNTFWQQSDVNLSKGMDFVPRGDVFARFTHLQHVPYTMNIQVNNDTGARKLGMVRVFMGPKMNDKRQQWNFNEQRRALIELDKFVAQLNPGANLLKRRSTESTVTIPYERTFRNLDVRPAGDPAEAGFNFCGCGWPQHMLIPRGTTQGFPCELFVMVSNYDLDKVDQDLVGVCNDAASFCGIRDRKYPDKRAMGYPFDRLGRQGVNSLQQFMTPNMGKVDVSIQFSDRVAGPGSERKN